MKIYISGPMRGIPEWNHPAFDAAAVRIAAAGHDPVSPAELDRKSPAPVFVDTPQGMRVVMQRDTNAIFECDAIAVLPGWRQSAGAVAEVALSCVLSMPALDAIDLSDVTADVHEWWNSILGRGQWMLHATKPTG